MNNFVKKLMQFSMGPIIAAGISLITVPLTTHFISPEEFGRASMFALVQTLMMSFLMLGIDQAYTREFHSEKSKERLFLHAVLLPLIFAFILLLVFGLNAKVFSQLLFGSQEYPVLMWLIGIMGLLFVMERFLLLSIRMSERAMEFSTFTILIRLAILLITIFMIAFIRRDFLTVVYANIIGQASVNLILIIRYRGLLNLKGFQFDKSLLKRLVTFGFPLVFSVGIGSVLTSFDKVSLRWWSDFEQLGIFTAAMKLVGILLIIQNSFTTFWVPTAYRWYQEGKETKYYEMVSNVILTVMSIAFIFLLIFKGTIVWILSPEYSEAKYLFGFLALFPIMYTISETTTLGIVFTRKSHLNIIVSVATAVSSIVLNFLLVSPYGAIGAAIATGISYIVFFLARTYLSFKVWKGFSVKKHCVIIVMLLALAVVNLSPSMYTLIINLISIPLILIINRDTTMMAFQQTKLLVARRRG